MKLHEYLEQVLGNKITISTLRVLVHYKGRIFTVRSLAQEAGASHPEVSSIVSELEKFGIVRVYPVGRAHQITLNEKSYVLNKIIEPILQAEEKTLAHVISILGYHLDTKKITSSVIFGSVATGQEKEDSDIDVLVISDYYDHAVDAIANASEDVALGFHTGVSPIIFTRKEFLSKKKGDLMRSILSNHIHVTGLELEKIK
ncbi:MAG: nucleotidyltransferase domain-containing protein [Nitrososphaera sp.]|jgi:predicted nucleotidyltransferase